MRNLTVFSIAKNKITSLPETIGYLTKLVDFRASHNLLTSLPTSIGNLQKLTTLSVNNNQIDHLPVQIGYIKSLTSLDLSENPLTVLPTELGRLKHLRMLVLGNCPLISEYAPQLTHSPPTLKELAARVIVRKNLPILTVTQQELKQYLAISNPCSYCAGPYFESFVTRVSIVQRQQMQIPFEYRLCCKHWDTEQGRILALFTPLPSTAPDHIVNSGLMMSSEVHLHLAGTGGVPTTNGGSNAAPAAASKAGSSTSTPSSSARGSPGPVRKGLRSFSKRLKSSKSMDEIGSLLKSSTFADKADLNNGEGTHGDSQTTALQPLSSIPRTPSLPVLPVPDSTRREPGTLPPSSKSKENLKKSSENISKLKHSKSFSFFPISL
jgi:hypothetical protein